MEKNISKFHGNNGSKNFKCQNGKKGLSYQRTTETIRTKPSSTRSPYSLDQKSSSSKKENANFEVDPELFKPPVDFDAFIEVYREKKLSNLQEKIGEIVQPNWELSVKLPK